MVAHAPRRAQGVCGETRRRSLFRTTKIRFYPTIFATFCFLAELGAQKGPKWALRGHQPIDFRPFRTPSRGIAAFSQNGHFSPTDRSFFTAQRGKRTAEPLIALSMPSRPSRDWRSATLKTIVHHVQLVSWRPSTAFDDGAPKSPFLAPFGQLAHPIPKKNKK